ncbi:hypothetical protein H0H93_012052, partial [Arthromyces matolae]
MSSSQSQDGVGVRIATPHLDSTSEAGEPDSDVEVEAELNVDGNGHADDDGLGDADANVEDEEPETNVTGRQQRLREREARQAAGVVEKRLTRRERKRLGLPKPNNSLGSGKIVIPGGRYNKRVDDGEEEVGVVEGEEGGGGGGDWQWVKNGTGRVD